MINVSEEDLENVRERFCCEMSADAHVETPDVQVHTMLVYVPVERFTVCWLMSVPTSLEKFVILSQVMKLSYEIMSSLTPRRVFLIVGNCARLHKIRLLTCA